MKVYLVFRTTGKDDDSVQGVFATEQLAQDAIDNEEFYDGCFYIQPFGVVECTHTK